MASILGNNTPIFVGIMSWLALRRRPRRVVLDRAGVVADRLPADHQRQSAARHGDAAAVSTGDLMALTASVFFAAYLIMTERVRRSMDTLTFNALAIAGSVVTLLAIALALRLPLTGFPPRTWAALAGLGLITQLAAYYALVYALGHLPATITSVGLLAQIPGTTALAWLLLDEPLTPVQLVGGAVVLSGIYVVNRYSGES